MNTRFINVYYCAYNKVEWVGVQTHDSRKEALRRRTTEIHLRSKVIPVESVGVIEVVFPAGQSSTDRHVIIDFYPNKKA